jgi:hypothetical protein
VTIDEVWIGNWIYWTFTLVTTNNYDSLTELLEHTTAHTKSSQSALQQLPMADVSLPLCFRTVTGLSYQLLTSHNCNSQLTQLTTQVKSSQVKFSLQPTVSRPVCLDVKPHLETKAKLLLLSDSCGSVDVGRPL